MTATTYLKFMRLLAARQRDVDDSVDIRQTILDRRQGRVAIGYAGRTLEKAMGANMRQLFPTARANDEEGWEESDTFLLTGSLFANPEHSHPGLLHGMAGDIPLDDTFLFELGFLASTHSWSYSFQRGDPAMACLGYVYDDLAHYFMADYPNRLIRRLNSDHALSPAETARARGLIDRIVQSRISKYNAQSLAPPSMTTGYTRRVLVCDQTYADASTVYGRIDEAGFEAMLLAALEENPDAEILIKSHPDTSWVPDKRQGYYNHLTDTGRVRILRTPINPFLLFDLVDKVYVGTSQLGLEALFAGKPVVTFGAPFYAGWGLTDDRQEIPHRQRSRTLEELFHAFYIWYTIYHLPEAEEQAAPAEIEEVLDYIEQNRPVAPPEPKYTATDTPRVSVVIPVYRVHRYIEQCLRSVQEQSLQDIEIITVNDRSPDTSQAVIDRLAAEDPRIRPIVLKENIGQGFARNIGLDQARGTYVLCLDSDDYLASPDHLQRVYDCAEADQADMVRGRKKHERVEDATGAVVATPADISESFFDVPFHGRTVQEEPRVLQNRHFWTWLYRREFLNDNKIRFLTSQWEERPFMLRALLSARRLSSIDSDGFVYRVRYGSTARRAKTETDAFNQLANLEQMVDILDEFDAFAPGSDLRYTAGFMILQAVHILFHGFAYQIACAAPQRDGRGLFLERLSALLDRAGLEYEDLSHDPHQLSKEWLGCNAYQLLFEALRSRRYDYVDIVFAQEAITQETLFEEMLRPPETAREDAFQIALALYARNEKVITATGLDPVTEKPRLVLHVGQTKTGSTFIQHFMEHNRAALLRAGIWYPETGLYWQKPRPHKQAGHADIIGQALRGQTAIRDHIEAGLSLAGGRIHTVILSSEAYFLNRKSLQLADHMAGYPLTVIGYFRRQDDWANSQYSEFVAGGALGRVWRPFQDWIDDPVTGERLDYFGYCQMWGARIGRKNVIAALYDRTHLRNGDIVSDFLAQLGLEEMDSLPRPAQRYANTFPFDRPHIDILREINRYDWPDANSYFSFIDEITRSVTLLRAQQGAPVSGAPVIQPLERYRLMHRLQDSNARLTSTFLKGHEEAFALPAEPRGEPETGLTVSEAEISEIFAALDRYDVSGRLGNIPLAQSLPEKPDPADVDALMRVAGIYSDFVQVPEHAAPGEELELEIMLFNTSDLRLPTRFDDKALKLSYHILDPKRQPVIWNGERAKLPAPVDYSCLLSIPVIVPEAPGDYLLQSALVWDGQRWIDSLQTWPLRVA